MRRLILLRHAKSDWPAGVADQERPLAARGREAAPVMGHYLANERLLPDHVVISPARRTQETWDLVAAELPQEMRHRIDGRIYEAKAEALLGVIHDTPSAARTLLLIGHNPGLAELAGYLTGHGDRFAFARIKTKYPTCGLAVLDFPVESWAGVAKGLGRLERFVTPAMLGNGPDE
jgi:phosphohistidine phosphatase